MDVNPRGRLSNKKNAKTTVIASPCRDKNALLRRVGGNGRREVNCCGNRFSEGKSMTEREMSLHKTGGLLCNPSKYPLVLLRGAFC